MTYDNPVDNTVTALTNIPEEASNPQSICLDAEHYVTYSLCSSDETR